MSQNVTDNKSTLVQVKVWCHQASSHYLSQHWLRSRSSYGITRPQGVKGSYSVGSVIYNSPSKITICLVWSFEEMLRCNCISYHIINTAKAQIVMHRSCIVNVITDADQAIQGTRVSTDKILTWVGMNKPGISMYWLRYLGECRNGTTLLENDTSLDPH